MIQQVMCTRRPSKTANLLSLMVLGDLVKISRKFREKEKE